MEQDDLYCHIQPPGGEHTHFCRAITSGVVGTYEEKDISGITEAMKKSLQGSLRGASRASQGVSRGGAEGGGVRGESDGGGNIGDHSTNVGRYIGGKGDKDQ